MILRKPYAFFIKIFKPLHFFMAALTMYLIYATNKILVFFNSYIYSENNVVNETITENLSSVFLIIIPAVLIAFSLIFLGIMFSKKKPIVFYIINMFSFLIILIITIYVNSFLGMMEKSILPIKLVKFNHDLVVINIIIEVIVFILLIIRGLGLDFKKFNFNSDISKLSIDESDREEFELRLNVDLETSKRNRKRNIRNFKYFYKENKIKINIAIVCFFIFLSSFVALILINKEETYKEGNQYTIKNFNLIVNKTMTLNKNYDDKKITDNELIFVDFSVSSGLKNVYLYEKDFKLEVDEFNFSVTKKYKNDLIDLGIPYEKNILTNHLTNYYFVFEIPKELLNSKMYLSFNNEGVKTKIKLNPQKLETTKTTKEYKTGEMLDFKDSLGAISFKIKNYEIKPKFVIKYKYCFKKDDCLVSKEYIVANPNQNFDKYVLKLNVEFSNESELKATNFYDFFSKFGYIKYKINEKWFTQNANFENIKSKKVNNKNNVYIGIHSEIFNADSIKFVFNARDIKYEYILK